VKTGVRIFWLLTGLASVVIGAVGVVLPLLPTTPFLLIAAFAFARSSARLDRWLRGHPSFGSLIENWDREGSIDRRTKRIALVVLLLTPVASWFIGAPSWVIIVQIVVLSGAALFILTRPSPSAVHRK